MCPVTGDTIFWYWLFSNDNRPWTAVVKRKSCFNIHVGFYYIRVTFEEFYSVWACSQVFFMEPRWQWNWHVCFIIYFAIVNRRYRSLRRLLYRSNCRFQLRLLIRHRLLACSFSISVCKADIISLLAYSSDVTETEVLVYACGFPLVS